MSDIKAYFMSIPPFTRYFTSIVFVSSMLMTYGLISPYKYFLFYELVFKHGHIWRLITTFLYAGKFGPSFLFGMLMLYFTCKRTEEWFKNKGQELMTLILFNAFMIMIYSAIYGNSMVLHQSFIFSLMYVCCKLDPDSMVSIWGFPVQSSNLPWVMLLLGVLQGGDPIPDLIGIADRKSVV